MLGGELDQITNKRERGIGWLLPAVKFVLHLRVTGKLRQCLQMALFRVRLITPPDHGAWSLTSSDGGVAEMHHREHLQWHATLTLNVALSLALTVILILGVTLTATEGDATHGARQKIQQQGWQRCSVGPTSPELTSTPHPP